MSTDLKRRTIPFSPPAMTEAEANEVRDAILSMDYDRSTHEETGEVGCLLCRCER